MLTSQAITVARCLATACAFLMVLSVVASCSTDRQWADVATVVQHTQPTR